MIPRNKVMSQQQENEMVKKVGFVCIGPLLICLVLQELDLLESDAVVYKLIGPVLVKQDLDDCKMTVNSRLKHFKGQM